MNILSSHPLSFVRATTGVASTQTRSFFWRSPRPSQARHQRKVPEKVTVDFEISKLFKDQKLNQNYINEMIAKNLQSDLPKNIKVTDKSKSGPASAQTTTHTQPSTSNSNDFFLFYLIYLNSVNMMHSSQNSHVSYAYSDELYDDRHSHNHDDHSKPDHSKDDSQYTSTTNHDSSYSSYSSHSDSSYSHSTYDSTPTSSYDSSSSSSFDSGSSGGSDGGSSSF